MASWAWLWTAVVLAGAVAASRDDIAEGVASWKVALDATVALFTAACVVVYVGDRVAIRESVKVCLMLKALAVGAFAWTATRSFQEYHRLKAAGEIASRADHIMAGLTSVFVAMLYIPAWYGAWRGCQ